jgi:amino acid permease
MSEKKSQLGTYQNSNPTMNNKSKNEIQIENSPTSSHGTERKLESRHIQMVRNFIPLTHKIAIGGTIGTGLLVTSGSTLAGAGALGALIAYVIAGISIFFVVTSLGEMATLIPVTGSFSSYASRFVDPALGFAIGWIYWLGWVTTFPIELLACGSFLGFCM